MIEQLRELVREMRESSDSHAQAGTRYSEADDVENANLRWGMAEVLRIAAAKCESLLTQRPKGESLLPAQPAATFVNAGDSEAQFIADGEHLNCSTCGGSGHVDDASRSVVSELLGALEGVVAVADRQTDEFDRARAAQQRITAQAVQCYPGLTSLELSRKSQIDRYTLARRLPELPEIDPHDHPDNHVMKWRDDEIRWIKRYATSYGELCRTAAARSGEDAWKVGMFDRWNDYAKQLGYSGMCDALSSIPELRAIAATRPQENE